MKLMTSTTVLLCSSSDSVAHAWTQALEPSARLVLARDYEQALERVLLDSGLKLLLLDSNWSPFDGARLISRLRGESSPRLASLPIFLLEQSGQSATAELWLREGADGLLSGRRETQAIAGLLRQNSAVRTSIDNGPIDAPKTDAPKTDTPKTEALNGPVLDIELKWQPADTAASAADVKASTTVDDWALEFGVRLRADDRWQARSNCSGELKLRCGRPDVLAPLNRLARALHNRAELANGRLTARFDDTTYQLPI